MDFDKGWGRIERLLLIVAVILSIFAIGNERKRHEELMEYSEDKTKEVILN